MFYNKAEPVQVDREAFPKCWMWSWTWLLSEVARSRMQGPGLRIKSFTQLAVSESIGDAPSEFGEIRK